MKEIPKFCRQLKNWIKPVNFVDIQFVPHWKHISATQHNWLTLFREYSLFIMYIIKDTNTFFGQYEYNVFQLC